VRRPPPALSERRSDPLAGFTPEPFGRQEPLGGGRQEPQVPREPLGGGRQEPQVPREPLGGRQEPLVPREPLGGRPDPRPELRPEPMPSRVTSRNEPVMPRPRPSEALKAPPVRSPERAAAPPPPPAQSSADQNLAEMAQRLEAALRRPTGEAADARVGAPPVAPEPPPARSGSLRSEQMPPPVAAPAKSGFEDLEDEMASLLGRPKTPT
jgi:flagellar protein FliO/FliZ